MFFAQRYFLITNVRVATEEFFCYVVLLLLNWSWFYNFVLGLGLNILVLFPSLVQAKADKPTRYAIH